MSIVAKHKSYVQSRTDNQPISLDAPAIVCRNCNGFVTEPDCQIDIDGAFCHTFANPHGQVFEIGCFNAAPGCLAIPPPFAEFSWFRGYSWNIGVCYDCKIHLGWVYRSDPDRFWGIILDKLVFP